MLPPLLLILLAALTPLPPLLRDQHRYDSSIRILDRHGKTLMEVRADDGARARWVPLDQISPELQRAMVAAEDQRFARHPGIDPIAIGRATFQNLWHRRVVSGASTLTQQLGRNVSPRPRTLRGKVREMALALRIEASLSKEQILEHYLNLVSFGPSLRGVEAGSRFWFDKPANALSLAEAAMLAAIPRGPSMYNPLKAPDAVRQRRDRILDRMLAAGAASQQDVERAKREPLSIHGKATGWGAPHYARSLLSGAVHPEVG
ncbi:MAG TPA: biosynthetic peptidoglycan transglycosylase, partial [Polyangiaceae bacterium]|nr:biosynthetic peptidoglycan transglycosylase [Polyangiaceae bacterium]